ncbi:MAG: CHAT domain-containing tetratricopeptide repeat protein [bacterium]
MNKKILLLAVCFIQFFVFSNILFAQETWETLNEKTNSYYQQGKYEIAIEYAQKAIKQAEKDFGKESKYYAASQNFLALLYQQMEEYLKAEPLYLESSKALKKFFGDGHPLYGQSVQNIGSLYHQMNRYKDAEEYLKLARDIFGQNYGIASKEYAHPTYSLAKLYYDEGKFKDAERYFLEVLPIYKKEFDTSNINSVMSYITPLFELATLYKVQRQFKKSEPLYAEILDIYRELYTENSAEYAHSLSNLADIKDILGEQNLAEKMLDTALILYDRYYGPKHQNYTKTLQRLSRVYDNQGKYEKAKNNWNNILDEYLNQINNYFPALSDYEKGRIYSNISPNFEEFNSFVIKWMDKDKSLIGKMYDNQLATKALLLNASTKVRRRILNSGDRQLIEKFESWRSIKEKLATFYSLPKERLEKGKIDIGMFEKKANLIERELSRESEIFAQEYTKKSVSWKEIQNRLQPGEAAIEIVRFRHYSKHWLDSIYYAALIIDSKTSESPRIVLLSNGKQLEDEYLKCYKNMIKHQLLDRDSYWAYWEKIEEKLGTDIKSAYVSLDAVYNQINLSSLQLPNYKYLLDTLEVHLVHNTRYIVDREKNTETPAENYAELFGYPDFNYDKSKEKLAMVDNTAKTSEMMNLDLASNKPWDSFKIAKAKQEIKLLKVTELPGTEQEINEIYQLLNAKNWQLQESLREKASEGAVKKIKNPKILHIATHGFFLKDIDESPDSKTFGVDKQSAIENPLLRSGLLFAGATLEISGAGNFDVDDNDNGILTAFEAMNLDLDKTELVVLSACETGLGEVKNGEGVYGLQRAFEVAGAKAIIMSLWTVDDYATRELMTTFYSNWLASGNKRDAFKEAQLFMKNKYRWPYYWGAFVMVGE